MHREVQRLLLWGCVQVGVYARFLLAGDYLRAGQSEKAAAVYRDIRTNYPDAVDHSDNRLVEKIPRDQLQ